ncbi:MAG: SLC13 family permease [Myxococcota bacterium]|nr:SLC13 family permease [Myxococcota bacterium]
MMTLDAWLTLATLALTFVALVLDRYAPEVVLTCGLCVLIVTGVLSPKLALGGFSNPALITLAALYVLTGSLRETGALDGPASRLLAGCRDLKGARRRLTLATAPLSAFLNNTPIVAATMPIASRWARRHGLSAGGLLMPISYAAVLGGTCTVFGTATHLVVHGLLLERGMEGLGVFELMPIGLPIVCIGLPLIWFLSRRLLDGRNGMTRSDLDERREYTADLMLLASADAIGRTIEDAGLRHLPGLFLVRIERDGKSIAPVNPMEILAAGDRLTFAGVLTTIVDLQRRRGFVPAETEANDGDWTLHEAVVSRGSPLIGRSIRETNFRGRYNAAIVAVHRHGERLQRKIGDIVIRHGDTLLMQAASGFSRTFRDSTDFYLISEVAGAERPRHQLSWLALSIVGLVVGLSAAGVLPLVTAAIAGACAAIVSGCISVGAARRSVDTSVLVVMGAALGLATAFESSGLSSQVGAGLMAIAGPLGPWGLLVAIYITGLVLTELITNTAAAALLFPVALALAQAMGHDPRPFVLATSISAAVSLATPLGYQTNMMVYGPGGYRFVDFLKMGLPVQLVCGAVGILAIGVLYGL